MRRACSCVPPQIRAKVISAGPKSMLVTSPPHPVQLATNDDNHEDSSVTGALPAVLRSSSAKETSPARRDVLGGCARLPRASQTPWSGPRPGSWEETGAFRSALPAAGRHSSAQTPLPAHRLSRPQVAGLVHRPAGAAAYRARSQSHRLFAVPACRSSGTRCPAVRSAIALFFPAAVRSPRSHPSLERGASSCPGPDSGRLIKLARSVGALSAASGRE
jgi:hypothetical protein